MKLSRQQALYLPVLISAIVTVAAAEVPNQNNAPVVALKPGATQTATQQAGDLSVEELTNRAKKSIVVISFSGRNGEPTGLGTGFAISNDGLIATNLHVIGEARPISVKTADGKQFEVKEIHASERSLDLAILRIDSKELPALELADSDALKQGQDVVAIGNPQGLQYSVVSGVVSGRREIDGKPMIQLAIPIEPGNSGGPLLDRKGRVNGILTLKSAVTRNLGFAVAVNALKPLIAKPNPVPMSRWLTIGTLDHRKWIALNGANWKQRAGRIIVEGAGEGFGGRSLALSTTPAPALPFEMAVWVKLDNEAGAAGLVFHSDGRDRHYGFYPSAGRMRLSRFDGPDVYSWHVLAEVPNRAYHPGEWNRLKVRLEKGKIQCFVNDELAIESTDAGLTTGAVGLAKFRDTVAEFKGFVVGEKVPDAKSSPDLAAQIAKLVAEIPADKPPSRELIDKIDAEAKNSVALLQERARLLTHQAERLQQLATQLHQKQTRQAIAELLSKKDEEIDLLHAALLISQLDNPELEVDAYLKEIDRMVEEVQAMSAKGADEATRLAALDKYLFEELGFHGSRTNYYSSSNSYMNEVIDDREGLPITLSVLYMELARRIGLNVVGVGLPGHFIVRYEPKEGQPALIDPYDRGKRMTRAEVEAAVQSLSGQPLKEEFFASQTKKQILMRMLTNLSRVAQDKRDSEGMLRYTEAVLVIEPESAQHHWFRAVLRFQTERIQEAIEDTEWLLAREPAEVDMPLVRQLRETLEEAKR